jgi:hypothetical protein
MKFRGSLTAAGAALSAVLTASAASAAPATVCTLDKFCYCVNTDLNAAIDNNVALIRSRIREQRAQGKAVGYMSIPLSSLEGSYFAVNAKIADETKARVEKRFGPRFVWVLNPGTKEFSLPQGASGADYMLMWTRVLQGDDGLGSDFDFVYFSGPEDFARFFPLRGNGDMQKLDAYYDKLAKTDPGIKAIDKAMFRKYYALRASVAFSYGSHDEWNIIRAINERRRASDPKLGMARQLGVMFDGRSIAPGLFDAATAPGTVGDCKGS